MKSIARAISMFGIVTALCLGIAAVHAADAPSAQPATVSAPTLTPANPATAEPALDFFGDKPIAEAEIVYLPPPKPAWMTIGGPIALLLFFLSLIYAVYRLIPFRETPIHFDLHDLPVAAQRGIGMAVVLFGFAFLFGAAQVHYQLSLYETPEAYFQQMSVSKLITMTHAHMFGFTTSFFIIGIPFSLHFHRLRIYQWIFPLGLAASLTDIIAWWGLKFVSGNFEFITWMCGFTFMICYGWILIGLVRVIFFPKFRWAPDYINDGKKADSSG